MKVIDPGHMYKLLTLDGGREQNLVFVKRKGPGFPGNKNKYPGTTCQSVLRALVDRVQYLDNQIPCRENKAILNNLKESIWLFEKRAADRHGLIFNSSMEETCQKPMCPTCGHTKCNCD